MKIRKFIIGIFVLLFWSIDAGAQSQYFQGKTIRFIVGYSAALLVATCYFS
jgi:hypothetical protein